jgi:hypothetical protein
MDLGFEAVMIDPLGGAQVQFENSGTIMVYGYSDTYGACDKKLAAQLVSAAFPKLKVMTD